MNSSAIRPKKIEKQEICIRNFKMKSHPSYIDLKVLQACEKLITLVSQLLIMNELDILKEMEVLSGGVVW